MDASGLSLTFSDINAPWLCNREEVYLRVTYAEQSLSVGLNSSVTVKVTQRNTSVRLHICLQSGHISLGSMTWTIERMFGGDLAKQFDEWISLDVPRELRKIVKGEQAQIKVLARLVDLQVENIDPSAVGLKLKEELSEDEPSIQKSGDEDLLRKEEKIETIEEKNFEVRQKALVEIEEKSEDKFLEEIVIKEEENVGILEEQQLEPETCKTKVEQENIEAGLEQENIEAKLEQENIEAKLEQENIEAKLEQENIEAELEQKNIEAELEQKNIDTGLEQETIKIQAEIKQEHPVTPSKDETVLQKDKFIIDLSKEEEKIESVHTEQPESAEVFEISSHSKFSKPKKRLAQKSGKPKKLPVYCPYIKSMAEIEANHAFSSSVIAKLKEQVSPQLFEESPKKRPRKKPRRKGKTPVKTPIKTPTLQEKHELTIPSHSEILIESLENEITPQHCLVGLMLKKKYLESTNLQIADSERALEAYSKEVLALNSSMVETRSQFSKEAEKLEHFKIQLTNQLTLVQESKQKLKHKHFALSKEKENLKIQQQEIPQSKPIDLSPISDLLGSLAEIHKSTDDIYISTGSFAVDQTDVQDLVSQRNEKYQELQREESELERMTDENIKLKQELITIKGEYEIEKHHQDRISESNANLSKSGESLLNLKAEILKIRSQHQEIEASSLKLTQKLQKDIPELEQIPLGIEKRKKKCEEELNFSISKIEESEHYTSSLELMLHERSSNETKKKPHKKAQARQNLGELDYFSDFSMKIAQTCLLANRTKGHLIARSEERDQDILCAKEQLKMMQRKFPVYFSETDDEVDRALGEYLNYREDELLVTFLKVSKGSYLFGSKRVILYVERDKLFARVGGGSLFIEDFIRQYTHSELAKLEYAQTSPKARKALGKWAEEILVSPIDKTPKATLRSAARNKKHTVAYAFRRVSRRKQ